MAVRVVRRVVWVLVMMVLRHLDVERLARGLGEQNLVVYRVKVGNLLVKSAVDPHCVPIVRLLCLGLRYLLGFSRVGVDKHAPLIGHYLEKNWHQMRVVRLTRELVVLLVRLLLVQTVVRQL